MATWLSFLNLDLIIIAIELELSSATPTDRPAIVRNGRRARFRLSRLIVESIMFSPL
jgi:hypothetical protein